MTRIMMKRPVFKHIPKAHNHMEKQHCMHRQVATNIEKLEDGYNIQLAVPGIDKSQVELYVEKDILHIGMKKSEEKNTSSKNYMLKQFDYSQFCKRFELSQDIDKENIKASYENGILNIQLRNREDALIKRIIDIK